jgi:uncharacterized protein involved in oxidation of intracellular sulfur
MQRILFLILEGAYGTQRAYNALRLARIIQIEHQETEVRVFMIGDAVACALANQQPPEGFYNLEKMLDTVVSRGGRVAALKSSLEIRGMATLPLVHGLNLATMSDLATWTLEVDKVITF